MLDEPRGESPAASAAASGDVVGVWCVARSTRVVPRVRVAAPAPPAPQAREATRLRTEAPSPLMAKASPLMAKAERFAVQVGAFSENENAERLAENLRKKGFDAYVSAGAKVTQPRWRVRVGPFPDRNEAERAAGRLKKNENLPTWVLDENAAG